MANATVEKLKALGLRHGEKAVVGLAAALCLLFLGLAIAKPTIDLTPDQVAKTADAAKSNLARKQDEAAILAKLETDGIKNVAFEALVDNQINNKLNPNEYKVANPWVVPEPGAGLIRDQPKLIAPTDLFAHAGRGGALLYELDENGERVEDKGTDAKKKPRPVRGRGSRGNRGGGSSGYGGRGGGYPGMGGSGGYGPMGGMMGGNEDNLSPAQKEERKRQREIEEKRLKGALVGGVDPEAEKAKEKEQGEGGLAAGPQPVWKEEVRGLRWVAITGVLDYKALRANYLEALKDPAIAYPNFKRLDVERQVLRDDGSWSDWELVEAEKNWKVLDNLPEEDEEFTPDDVRLQDIVDPLPFLRAGYWEKVHVTKLVPKEKREIRKDQFAGGGMMGGYAGMGGRGGYGSMMGGSAGMMGGNEGGMMGGRGGGYPGMGGRGGYGPMGGSGGMMGGSAGMMGGNEGGMMMMGGAGGATDDMNFAKSERDEVMVRSLDFTVDPGTTYRFRTRLVVRNPNLNREDVGAGTDTESAELTGPWSEPTNTVEVPSDVAVYALEKDRSGRRDEVLYQVASFDPKNGVTVVKQFSAAPGQVVGDFSRANIPSIEGTGVKAENIDFTSRAVVLDSSGGAQAVPRSTGLSAQLPAPVVSLVLRNDGTVVLRSAVRDADDPSRKEMESTYRRAIAESNKKREPAYGGYGGMMGGNEGGPGGR